MSDLWIKHQKKSFTGKGNQWIYYDVSLVKKALEEAGKLDISKNYIDEIEKAEIAWVRYHKPCVDPKTGINSASFEVRYLGSKIAQPDVLVYIPNEDILCNDFKRLKALTPTAEGLEKEPVKKNISNKTTTKSKLVTKNTIKVKSENNIKEETKIITNKIPASLDPAEWEEFLLKEGFDYQGNKL